MFQGYCKIQWKQSSATTPDPFGIGTTVGTAIVTACAGFGGYIAIPHMSPDGVQAANGNVPAQAYIDRMCGADFGHSTGLAGPLVCKLEQVVLLQSQAQKN